MRGRDHTLVRIHAQGAAASLGIELRERLSEAASEADSVDHCPIGPLLGIKGVDRSPGVPRGASTSVSELSERGVVVPVFVEGGIRRDMVELLAEAGADGVFPGSFVFGHSDPCPAVRWLQRLGNRNPSIESTQPRGTQP